MALVAYENSDSSDFEDDDNDTSTVVTLNTNIQVSVPSISDQADNNQEDTNIKDSSLFNLLPQPSTKKPAVVEEDDEFLHKKANAADVVKPRAKITVPSLKDFKDVDSPTPIAKPKQINGKKSGLLSILPEPRNGLTITSTTTSKSMIPHVLTKKPSSTTNKHTTLPSPAKKSKLDPKALVDEYSDDSDNDEDVKNDFFSFNKPDIPIADIPLDIDQDLEKEAPSSKAQKPTLESFFKKDPVKNNSQLQPEPMDTNLEYAEAGSSYEDGYGQAESNSNNDVILDEEAILKLCGARGKHKREEIQIVDVNQQQVLADAREWLLKGLMDDTTKRVSSSKRKGNEPTSQQKRKHQITYLAHQAKANEAELQNQWANSRMSRRQTQNKYGF